MKLHNPILNRYLQLFEYNKENLPVASTKISQVSENFKLNNIFPHMIYLINHSL